MAYEKLRSFSAMAKAFGRARKTVRKVRRRREEDRKAALNDRSRLPLKSLRIP